MRISVIVVLLVAVGFCGIVSATEGDVVLVKDGEPVARIVVDPESPGVTKYAATELQYYVRKSTGATLPIVGTSVGDDWAEVVVGAAGERFGIQVDKLLRDGFVIRTIGNRLFVAGRDSGPDHLGPAFWRRVPRGTEAATLFGVYEVLERYVGVRWYLPVDIGEVVPKRRSLVIPATNIVDSPDKLYRDIHMDRGCDDVAGPLAKVGQHFVPDFETEEELAAFRRRRVRFALRMRYGLAPAPGSHTLQHIASHTTYLDTLPDMFARTEDGVHLVPPDTRSAHHCFTSPELIDKVTAAAEAFFEGRDAREVGMRGWTGVGLTTPKGKVLHIAPSDGYRACWCDRCEAFRQGMRGSDLSDAEVDAALVWSFLRQIARDLEKDHPDSYISTSAYPPIQSAPKEKLPRNLLLLKLAVEGPYEEFVPGMRESVEAQVAAWRRVIDTSQVSLFHYANAAGWRNTYRSDRGICGSLPRTYAAHYRRTADRGTGTRLYLNPHNWIYDHLSVYVFYKVHWDTDLDVDQLLGEYFRLFYGKAAAPMSRFWGEVETQFTKTLTKVIRDPLGPRGVMQPDEVIWGQIYSKDVVDRWKGYFAEAGELVRDHDNPVYAHRLALIRRNTLDMIVDGWERHKDLVAAVERMGKTGKSEPMAILNAGFEEPVNDTHPWRLWGKSKKGLSFARDTRVRAEGNASALLTGQARRVAIGQTVEAVAAEVYRFSFQYRGQMKQGSMRIKLRVDDPMPGGARGWTIDQYLTHAPEWTPHRILFQAPVPAGMKAGDTIKLVLSLQADQMMEGDRLWYDDVNLECLRK